uniref:Uncharacterized protein n=1 Tax=Romanomermis culicivorax TaxID=13658 RepID=A0A915HFJ4_ROMCU
TIYYIGLSQAPGRGWGCPGTGQDYTKLIGDGDEDENPGIPGISFRDGDPILKTKQYFNGEHVDTLAEYTVTKSARRVSWAEKPCIKLFETADAAVSVKQAFLAGEDVDGQDMMLAREEMILSGKDKSRDK